VSGHGHAVQSIGLKLRELMQKYLTALDQPNLMRDLNEAVIRDFDGIHYATMVSVGFRARRGMCVMTNAGHPPALWYRADRDAWQWIEPQVAVLRTTTITGMPLGLMGNVSYPRIIVRLSPGDFIVLYSDGISEAKNAEGEELGRARLMTLARGLSLRSAVTFGLQLLNAIDAFRGPGAPEDDQTIIVLQPFPEQSN
jgi:sigma-B regulation protein RsbU (phosphoserine phosphatase)